jgi:hypothetical protein
VPYRSLFLLLLAGAGGAAPSFFVVLLRSHRSDTSKRKHGIRPSSIMTLRSLMKFTVNMSDCVSVMSAVCVRSINYSKVRVESVVRKFTTVFRGAYLPPRTTVCIYRFTSDRSIFTTSHDGLYLTFYLRQEHIYHRARFVFNVLPPTGAYLPPRTVCIFTSPHHANTQHSNAFPENPDTRPKNGR